MKTNPCSPRQLPLLLFASLACLSPASAQVIFQDDFSGAAGQLHGTTPDITTGGSTWNAYVAAAPTGVNLTGSGSVSNASTTSGTSSWLLWTPSAGNIYELSVDMISSGNGTTSNFAGIGFFDNSMSANGQPVARSFNNYSPVTPWVFVRTGNSNSALIGDSSLRPLGSATTGNGAEQSIDSNFTVTNTMALKLVLNTFDTDLVTAGTQFSLQYFVGSTQYGTTVTYTDAQSTALLTNITRVGFTTSTNLNAVSFDNFKLEAIPEPATWVLLGGGLTALMIFRRRRA